MKILIVDDNAEGRRILKYYLESHGCETMEACDGRKGLDIAIQQRPGLIISGVLMPVMDGFQLLREVRKTPALATTPFVFYSATYTGDRVVDLAMDLGADAFIAKPKTPEEFWRELNPVLEGCAARERRPKTSLITGEEEYLRRYSSIVVAKLEEKCREMEQANTSLRESEARYRAMFENTPAVMLLIDPDTADIVDANPSAFSFYGYTRDELVRMKITDMVLVSAEEVLASLTKAKTCTQRVERQHLLKSGEIRDVVIFRGPLAIKNITYIFSIIHDITDRKQAEIDLRENEEKLRAITDTVEDAIIMTDNERKITYWNPTAERMFGYTRDEAMGTDISLIVVERYREAFDRGFRIFAKTGQGPLLSNSRERLAIAKGGREFPIEYSFSTVKLKGRWHAVGAVRDITERKSLEAQLRQAQKMEAIGTLAGGVAHDFNNILTVIIGFATIMQKDIAGDSPLASSLRHILSAGERAANLTRSLLAFSRKQAMELKTVDMNQVVLDAQKLLSRLLRDDTELRIKIAETVLPIRGDVGQIGQILLNLVNNAAQSMPNGGVISICAKAIELDEAFIKAHGFGKPGGYALLSVSDTGTGMDEETRLRIFEPFFTTRGVGEGTGLGLSIVYGIVKQHGGYINCYSEPGKGTTFRIYIPLILEAVKQNESAVAEAHPPRGTETILVAEDESMVRYLVKTILEQFGYTVIEARNGEEAVARFLERRDDIRLLLLDVIMPKRNGREVLEEARNAVPDIRHIFMSGYPGEVFQRDDILDIKDNVIEKPIQPSLLLRKIRETLDR
jgi:PAS domain S-box-containing protein